MAVESGLPVVPVAVSGSRHVMLKGRLMTCPGEVHVAVHEPIPTRGMTRDDARALAARARDVVAQMVSSLDRPTSEPRQEG